MTAPPITVEVWCYIDAGGTWCYPPGSPEADAAGLAQADYLTSLGLAPSTDPWEVRFVEVPGTTTTVPQECFILIGGNFCFPAGSAEAIEAAEDEAEYLETIAELTGQPVVTVPPDVPDVPPPTPPTTVPELVATVTVPPERLLDDVIFEPVVEVAVGMPPVPTTVPQMLPVTGGGFWLGFTVAAVAVMSSGAAIVRAARR